MEKKAIFRCLNESFDGKGIINYKNQDYKFDGLLKGEEAEFIINKNAKYPLTLLNIVKKSENREKKCCPLYLECGGCQYQHMTYQHELELKENFFKDIFSHFRDYEYLGLTGMDNVYNYRNKCQMTFKLSKSHKVTSGLYEEHTHKLVSVVDCNIQNKKAVTILHSLNKILSKHHISIYDEYSRQGVLRHVLLRFGQISNEVMLILVTNGDIFPGRNNVVKDLLKENLGITTIVQNINGRDTSIVLSDKERILYGTGYIYDYIGDLKFKISSRAFYQVNSEGMNKLYTEAVKLANIKKTDVVLDTYCGVGTIGILASKYAKNVYGVELNKSSYKDAIINSKINNIDNIKFFNEDSTKFMLSLAEHNEKIDVVIMDPPRSGSTKEFIKSVAKLGAKKVIYVSCNPLTLERDCFEFSKVGYSLKELEAVDMFPKTFNLEAIALLTRKN